MGESFGFHVEKKVGTAWRWVLMFEKLLLSPVASRDTRVLMEMA